MQNSSPELSIQCVQTFKQQLFVFNTVFELSHFHLAVLIYSGSLLMDYKHILLAIKRKYFIFITLCWNSSLKRLEELGVTTVLRLGFSVNRMSWAWSVGERSEHSLSESSPQAAALCEDTSSLNISSILSHLFFSSCLFTFYAVSEGQINSFFYHFMSVRLLLGEPHPRLSTW